MQNSLEFRKRCGRRKLASAAKILLRGLIACPSATKRPLASLVSDVKTWFGSVSGRVLGDTPPMPLFRTILDELAKALVPSAVAAISGTAALKKIGNTSASLITKENVGIAILVAVLLASLYAAVTIGLRSELVRTLLKRLPPYEGIWLEEYKVSEPGEPDVDSNGNAKYNSVTVIRTSSEKRTPIVYGMTFRQHNIDYRSNYECEITHERDESRRIEMRYSGRWNDSNDIINGYAWYEFDSSLNEKRRFTSGVAQFMEFGIEAGHSFPIFPGVVRRLERASVKLAIQKKYPLTEKDYLTLSMLRTDQ